MTVNTAHCTPDQQIYDIYLAVLRSDLTFRIHWATSWAFVFVVIYSCGVDVIGEVDLPVWCKDASTVNSIIYQSKHPCSGPEDLPTELCSNQSFCSLKCSVSIFRVQATSSLMSSSNNFSQSILQSSQPLQLSFGSQHELWILEVLWLDSKH